MRIADTKDPNLKTVLELTPESFDVFLAEIIEASPTQSNGTLSIEVSAEWIVLKDDTGQNLIFDHDEWQTFVRGAEENDFSEERFLVGL